ncbi:MAG: ABC transporter permease [Candidatus Hodarchaeota archaeon]
MMFVRKKGSLKSRLRKIFAIIEKELYLQLRYKSAIILRIMEPIIQILILLFLYGLVFGLQEGYSIGYWNEINFVLFILMAFCLQLFRPITTKYFQSFIVEKYWKTLSATLIAPVNKFSLLLGILTSSIIINSIGFVVVFTIMYVLFPISLLYFLLFVLTFIGILISFASIGLLIGVFGISNEDFGNYFYITLRFIFLFTCINYPKEIFPEFIQFFILLNPLYYIVDLLRLVWYLGLDPGTAIIYITPIHIISIILFTVLIPILAIALFERVYKKYGITGY